MIIGWIDTAVWEGLKGLESKCGDWEEKDCCKEWESDVGDKAGTWATADGSLVLLLFRLGFRGREKQTGSGVSVSENEETNICDFENNSKYRNSCSLKVTCLATKTLPYLSRHLYPLWIGL